MPEFTGKQQKLDIYFRKASVTVKASEDDNFHNNNGLNTDLTSSFEQSGIVSDKEPNQRDGQVKRKGSDVRKGSTAKKFKKDEKQTSGGKQANLLSFFSAKNSKQPKEGKDFSQKEYIRNKNISADGHSCGHNNKSHEIRTENIYWEKCGAKTTEATIGAASRWKKLLKGPSPAPLCKGHKEPCVLRTVKKESLNKGRQFYVCNRPEGHKSNPEAKCDHFEWVDKNKKINATL